MSYALYFLILWTTGLMPLPFKQNISCIPIAFYPTSITLSFIISNCNEILPGATSSPPHPFPSSATTTPSMVSSSLPTHISLTLALFTATTEGATLVLTSFHSPPGHKQPFQMKQIITCTCSNFICCIWCSQNSLFYIGRTSAN